MPDDGNPRRYQPTGLVICGLCRRRLEGQWVHGRAGYRCRHGRTSGSDVQPGRAKTLYLREEQVLEQARIQFAHHIGADPKHSYLMNLPDCCVNGRSSSWADSTDQRNTREDWGVAWFYDLVRNSAVF
ncbi:zinc ribbon domain-containing protein [Actinoplanes sp. NPDC051346]|uniref:zinc ribbon domain-containing protein n=1 Tax=Actinoplanes sp. NPDC051346 TaxID=3155048 RepID=UPI0034470944